ncbi:MAG: hypothetical protein AB8H79_02665 [Myxococcota bacterium]
MREAGGLDTLQVELRGMGIPFTGVVALYVDAQNGDPDAEDAKFAADQLLDLGDEGDLPVIAVTEAMLRESSPFDGKHPGWTVIAPDGTIVDHFGGHGVGGDARQALIDHWQAQ